MKIEKAIALTILILFLSGLPVFSGGLTKIYVNGVKLGVYPKEKGGVAYIQATPLSRALGISISWNPQQRILKINGKVVNTTPMIEDGVLYLPVETVAGAAGATVEWDGGKNVIRITKAGAPAQKSKSTPTKPIPKMTPKKTTTYVTNPKVTPDIKMPSTGISYQKTNKTANKSTGAYTPKHPNTYQGQPAASAYPKSGGNEKATFQPKNAPPRMPSHLSMPPMGDKSPNRTYSSTNPFIPKSESNSTFRVTVTNMEYVETIKDYYKPKPGYRFVIVYLSQQNVSDEVQVYTGRFSLMDSENHSYDYIEGLSNFWLVILRPGGINFGYLVFEIPGDASPSSVVLHGLNKNAPLTVSLN